MEIYLMFMDLKIQSWWMFLVPKLLSRVRTLPVKILRFILSPWGEESPDILEGAQPMDAPHQD